MNIEHTKTKEVIKWFEEISKVPRCSKKEEQICNWLVNWAKDNDFEVETDEVMNVLIRIPGTKGYESSPIVVFQGHVDMVCEKTPESNHDFSKDAIKLKYEDGWLTADGTSLGADNGIAVAMAMAMALDKELPHGPLELLFTVDEETGLTGANALQPGFIKGKLLINLDSEDEGVFTVGCAGGKDTHVSIPMNFENNPSGYSQYKLKASGMKGGHSGIDINIGKANALRILSRAMDAMLKGGIDLHIADVKGGTAHNAIPRDSYAILYLKDEDLTKANEILAKSQEAFRIEFGKVDPNITLSIDSSNEDFAKSMTKESTVKTINLMLTFHHGVAAMSTDIADLVETSNNFAEVKINDNAIQILTSQRSSVVSRLEELTSRIEAIALISGGTAKSGGGYPPWQPNMDSKLLAKSVALYKKMYDKEPVIEVIHAGLECGIIGDKIDGMDMISIGPDLKYPHCPDEKVRVEAIGKVWDFVAELLKELK